MAGNTANTAVWGEADVLIAPISATTPVGNAAFSGDWEYVGLLDGDAGFGENQSVDSTDHNAWGYGVIATTHQGNKTQKTFTALEDNETVLSLIYDTSGMTFGVGTFSGALAVKDFTDQFKIAFVTRSGDNERRFISANYATAEPGDGGSESETNLQSRPITVTVYPTSDRELWDTYKGAQL
jgi:hypothetical protein